MRVLFSWLSIIFQSAPLGQFLTHSMHRIHSVPFSRFLEFSVVRSLLCCFSSCENTEIEKENTNVNASNILMIIQINCAIFRFPVYLRRLRLCFIKECTSFSRQLLKIQATATHREQHYKNKNSRNCFSTGLLNLLHYNLSF